MDELNRYGDALTGLSASYGNLHNVLGIKRRFIGYGQFLTPMD